MVSVAPVPLGGSHRTLSPSDIDSRLLHIMRAGGPAIAGMTVFGLVGGNPGSGRRQRRRRKDVGS